MRNIVHALGSCGVHEAQPVQERDDQSCPGKASSVHLPPFVYLGGISAAVYITILTE